MFTTGLLEQSWITPCKFTDMKLLRTYECLFEFRHLHIPLKARLQGIDEGRRSPGDKPIVASSFYKNYPVISVSLVIDPVSCMVLST